MKSFIAIICVAAALQYFDMIPSFGGVKREAFREELMKQAVEQCPTDECQDQLTKYLDVCLDDTKPVLNKRESEDVAYCFLGDSGKWILNAGCELRGNHDCYAAVSNHYDDCFEEHFSDMPTSAKGGRQAMQNVIKCINKQAGVHAL